MFQVGDVFADVESNPAGANHGNALAHGLLVSQNVKVPQYAWDG